MRRGVTRLLVVPMFVAFLLSACGPAQTSQWVRFETPVGARVVVDYGPGGTIPFETPMEVGFNHMVLMVVDENILTGLGYSDAEIEQVRARGAWELQAVLQLPAHSDLRAVVQLSADQLREVLFGMGRAFCQFRDASNTQVLFGEFIVRDSSYDSLQESILDRPNNAGVIIGAVVGVFALAGIYVGVMAAAE